MISWTGIFDYRGLAGSRFLRRFFRNSSYKIDSATINLGEFRLPRLTRREFHENGMAGSFPHFFPEFQNISSSFS